MKPSGFFCCCFPIKSPYYNKEHHFYSHCGLSALYSEIKEIFSIGPYDCRQSVQQHAPGGGAEGILAGRIIC